MIKYMINKIESSVECTWKVKRGGIKKKFQMSALKIAAVSTGSISKEMAIIDTVSSKISAITL